MGNERIEIAPPRITTTDTRRVPPPPKVVAPTYTTPEYQQWRAEVIARSGGVCQGPSCADPGRRARLYADHVHELKDGGEPFNPSNGQALCGACHQRKTLFERARRMGLR